METQTPNMWDVIPLNADKTKVKIKCYRSTKAFPNDDELLEIIEAECSKPEFICDFLCHPNMPLVSYNHPLIGTTPISLIFGNELFATFYTNKNHFQHEISAYDYGHFTPENPIQENGYPKLYDDIYNRMKSESGRLQTDDGKTESIKGWITISLNFEAIRPKVKLFIDDYLVKNPQYKYIRVFNKLINH